MTATAMTIFSKNGEKSPILQLDRATKDALAVYVQQSFPAAGRRKAVERLWDLRPDEARAVIEARPSQSTLDRIWKHPNGGWHVILPVFGAVVGQSADAFIIQERDRLAHERDRQAEQSARLASLGRDLAAVLGGGAGRLSRAAAEPAGATAGRHSEPRTFAGGAVRQAHRRPRRT